MHACHDEPFQSVTDDIAVCWQLVAVAEAEYQLSVHTLSYFCGISSGCGQRGFVLPLQSAWQIMASTEQLYVVCTLLARPACQPTLGLRSVQVIGAGAADVQHVRGASLAFWVCHCVFMC